MYGRVCCECVIKFHLNIIHCACIMKSMQTWASMFDPVVDRCVELHFIVDPVHWQSTDVGSGPCALKSEPEPGLFGSVDF